MRYLPMSITRRLILLADSGCERSVLTYLIEMHSCQSYLIPSFRLILAIGVTSYNHSHKFKLIWRTSDPEKMTGFWYLRSGCTSAKKKMEEQKARLFAEV